MSTQNGNKKRELLDAVMPTVHTGWYVGSTQNIKAQDDPTA